MRENEKSLKQSDAMGWGRQRKKDAEKWCEKEREKWMYRKRRES